MKNPKRQINFEKSKNLRTKIEKSEKNNKF